MSGPEVQIVGTRRCVDTRKAERWFKERGIKAHFRDLTEQGLKAGEIRNIAQVCGGIDALIDRTGREFEKRNLRYMSVRWDEALERWPLLTRTPIVRLGRRAVIGHAPEAWQAMIDAARDDR